MSRPLSITDQLLRNAERQQEAYAALSKALAENDSARRGRAQVRIAELTAEYHRLSDALRFNELEAREITTPRARKPGKPLRELALDALDELGTPASPGLIADLTAALTGSRPAPSRFASLRRDEENAARRNMAARPAWIVPAISAQQLTAIPRLLTSSNWDLERRIVGARSIRTDSLRIVVSLARRLVHLREAGIKEAISIERLLFPFARSIPGAIEKGQPLEPNRIIEAAWSELTLIEDMDLEERNKAAAKLSSSTLQVRLWGRPVLFDTTVTERAIQ